MTYASIGGNTISVITLRILIQKYSIESIKKKIKEKRKKTGERKKILKEYHRTCTHNSRNDIVLGRNKNERKKKTE